MCVIRGNERYRVQPLPLLWLGLIYHRASCTVRSKQPMRESWANKGNRCRSHNNSVLKHGGSILISLASIVVFFSSCGTSFYTNSPVSWVHHGASLEASYPALAAVTAWGHLLKHNYLSVSVFWLAHGINWWLWIRFYSSLCITKTNTRNIR